METDGTRRRAWLAWHAWPAERGAAVDGVSAVGQDGNHPRPLRLGLDDGTLAESILVRHACRRAREGHVR